MMSIKDYWEEVDKDNRLAKIARLRRDLHHKTVQSKRGLPEGRIKHLNSQIKRIERIIEIEKEKLTQKQIRGEDLEAATPVQVTL